MAQERTPLAAEMKPAEVNLPSLVAAPLIGRGLGPGESAHPVPQGRSESGSRARVALSTSESSSALLMCIETVCCFWSRSAGSSTRPLPPCPADGDTSPGQRGMGFGLGSGGWSAMGLVCGFLFFSPLCQSAVCRRRISASASFGVASPKLRPSLRSTCSTSTWPTWFTSMNRQHPVCPSSFVGAGGGRHGLDEVL